MSETKEDTEHLNLLRIFYFVMAALHSAGMCFGGLYLVVGSVLLNAGSAHAREAPPPEIGWIFIAIAITVMVVTGTIGVLQFLVGRRLGERKGYTFVFVIAVLTCLSMPLGTLLGVFTLIVLQRPTVKAAFGAA